ncbi:hypothetical protein NMY22_g2071 [Coprinellus aureogranulatus]|nr:hypothetical protein NMY22_g2071 [Coprinellus aureogranulatus]
MFCYSVCRKGRTTKESKIQVAKRVGSTILPEQYALDPDTTGSRVKGKADDMVTKYKEELALLHQSGGGIGDPNEQSEASEDANKYLQCYVGPNGPDVTTSEEVKNLWESINKRWPFFATMHSYMCTRPSAVPPAITTGVGPQGRSVLHLQQSHGIPPSSTNTEIPIDPALLALEPPAPVAETGKDPAMATPGEAADTPATPKPQAPPPPAPEKENTKPAATESVRRGPKPSTFDAEKHVKNAKQALKAMAPKRTFEDVLMFAIEQKTKLSKKKATTKQENESRRLGLQERDQILRMIDLGVYTVTEGKRKLEGLESTEKPVKKGRSDSTPLSSPVRQSSSSPSSSTVLDLSSSPSK